jgi:hypothetical protein
MAAARRHAILGARRAAEEDAKSNGMVPSIGSVIIALVNAGEHIRDFPFDLLALILD